MHQKNAHNLSNGILSSCQISLYSIGKINFTATLQICIHQNHNLSIRTKSKLEMQKKDREEKKNNHKFLLKLHKWNVYRTERYCA